MGITFCDTFKSEVALYMVVTMSHKKQRSYCNSLQQRPKVTHTYGGYNLLVYAMIDLKVVMTPNPSSDQDEGWGCGAVGV